MPMLSNSLSTSLSTMRPCGRPAAVLTGRIAGARSIITRSDWSSFVSSSSSSSRPAASSPPPSTQPDLAQRSLFVRVSPAPASLSERRSVLEALEQYGKADMFKKLADNGSFVCIASTTAMATALVQRSPMQYELLAETLQAAQPWGQPRVASPVYSVGVSPLSPTLSSSSSASASSSTSTSRSSSSRPRPLENRTFTLSIFPSDDYHHRSVVRASPLHGPWPRDEQPGAVGSSPLSTPVTSNADGYRETFVHNALKAVVPESASAAALCDWRPRAELASATSSDLDVHPALAHIQERRTRRTHAKGSVLSSLARGGGSSSDGNSNGTPGETKRPNP